MRNLFSSRISINATNCGLLLLRIGICILMVPHGYEKWMNYSQMKLQFMPFMGMPASLSLALVIFAELFCSILIGIGMATRLAAIPLVIDMSVALFMAHGGDAFGKGQAATLFLIPYIVLLFTGPGALSVDALINKPRR